MAFLETMRTIGFQLGENLTDFAVEGDEPINFCAENISYTPEVAAMARKCAKGNLSNSTSIIGKQSCKLTFSVPINRAPTINVAPNYFKLLQACAMKETTHTNGVSLVTHATKTYTPGYIEIIEKAEGTSPSQVVIKLQNAMGNAKFAIGDVGEPIKIDFEFSGKLLSIEDRAYANIVSPSDFDTNVPAAMISATITAFGDTQTFSKFTIDLGNTVELFSDPSDATGIGGAHVVSRNPSLEIDPDLELIATQGDYARLLGNETGALAINYDEGRITLSAPAVQLTSAYNPAGREGHVVNNKRYELKGSAGDDEFELLIGSKS